MASLNENIFNLRTNTEKYKDDTNSEVKVLKLEAREKLDKISQQHLHIQRLLHEMENENANNVKESVKIRVKEIIFMMINDINLNFCQLAVVISMVHLLNS